MTDIRPFGDAALHVELGEPATPAGLATVGRVHDLVARVAADRAVGGPWGAPVPGIASVLVPFDVRLVDQREAARRLARLVSAVAADLAPASEPRVHVIPVRYGGEDGPDLGVVAERLGLQPAQVVERHADMCYTVYILGFMPGFAYLGDLPDSLVLPRRETPRQRVPAGSVAIAGRRTAVYPTTTPGGWHRIGRTDVRMWDMDRDPPALLRPGDRVRFEPVG